MSTKRKDNKLLQKSFYYNGKRYFVYGHNANELYLKEKEKREELEKGYESRTNPTMDEYYKRWTNSRRDSLKESTLRGQILAYGVMSKIIIPSANKTFGDLKIKEVTIDDLRIVQTELKKERRTQTVNDYMAHLKHVMKDAMNERLINYNPCVLVKPLKRTEEKARDTHHRALSIEEQKAFFECERTKNSPYYNVFRMAILTGMRIGEIGALKNTDIRNGLINVERTITRSEVGGYTIGDTAKTEAGRRAIPINNAIRETIEAQRELNRLLYGNLLSLENRKPTDALLFRAVEGGFILPTPIDREIKRICKIIDIEPFTMHALRATFATRAIESGINPRTLQELLGHSNFNITMSLYGHVLNDTKVKAMESIEIAL